jgi:hypothetical protein
MHARFFGLVLLLGLNMPVWCTSQSRLGNYAPAGGDPARSWGGSYWNGGTGMFGGRNLGSSLTPGMRSLARGAAVFPAPTAIGLTQRFDPGLGVLRGTERFIRDVRPATAFVGADPLDLALPADVAVGPGLRNPPLNTVPPGPAVRVDANRANANAAAVMRVGPPAPNRAARTLTYAGDVGPAASESQIAARIKSRPVLKALGPIEVLLDQRTIVLRGSVATPHERELAARLVLLEAGVDNVRNELTVTPPLIGHRN